MSAREISKEDRDRIFASLPSYRRPDYKEDPEDVLGRVLDQLQGLASCVTVLGRADRTSEVQDELIDDALPMLGSVMMHLADEGIRARDEIADDWGFWAEHRRGGAK